MGLKEEISKILIPIFGNGIEKTLDSLFDENDSPQELYTMVHHMLSGVMGPQNADVILREKLNLKKFNIIEV